MNIADVIVGAGCAAVLLAGHRALLGRTRSGAPGHYRCGGCGALHGAPLVQVAGGALVPVPRPPDGWMIVPGTRTVVCSMECLRRVVDALDNPGGA